MKNRKPDFLADKPLKLAELPVPPELAARLTCIVNSYVRLYRLGECKVLVTREHAFWHLSISHEARYPTWHEICQARYRLLPADIMVAMPLPPKADYINLHSNCFHLYEIRGGHPDL